MYQDETMFLYYAEVNPGQIVPWTNPKWDRKGKAVPFTEDDIKNFPWRYMRVHMVMTRKICLEYVRDRDRFYALPLDEQKVLDQWEFGGSPVRIYLERPDNFFALCMGLHPRLGRDSLIRQLTPDLVRMIYTQ
jgi:hypothetical protein